MFDPFTLLDKTNLVFEKSIDIIGCIIDLAVENSLTIFKIQNLPCYIFKNQIDLGFFKCQYPL